MKPFDRFLTEDKGFTIKDSVTKQPLSKLPGYSTMGHVCIILEKEFKVWYGLHEYRLPPVLIYPRPFIVDGNKTWIDDRSVLDRYLSSLSNEEIYGNIVRFCNGKNWIVKNEKDN